MGFSFVTVFAFKILWGLVLLQFFAFKLLWDLVLLQFLCLNFYGV